AFELLDEPQYYDMPDQYNELVSALIAELRPSVPNYLFIVDAPREATIDGLDSLKTVNDPAVAYAFHFFEPLVFTHQGFSDPLPDRAIRYLRSVPYPARLTIRATNYAPAASDTVDPRPTIDRYVAEDWSAERIAARIKIAGDWARQHHARII